MDSYTPHAESPFSEGEDQELAAELLAVNSDAELDQCIGGMLLRAASAVGGVLRSAVLRILGGLVKGAVHKILPGLGRPFTAVASIRREPLSGIAGRFLGLESEGLSAEDQEFNAATQLVRLVGAAAAHAAASLSERAPAEVAGHAMIEAARRYAPGLVRSTGQHDSHNCGCGNKGGSCSCESAASGSWERRGRQVILHGV